MPCCCVVNGLGAVSLLNDNNDNLNNYASIFKLGSQVIKEKNRTMYVLIVNNIN